jgi:hypothetical protein
MLRIVTQAPAAAKVFNSTHLPGNFDPDQTYLALAVSIAEMIRGYINRMNAEGFDVPDFLWVLMHKASQAVEQDKHP